jgi:hypothetical protein
VRRINRDYVAKGIYSPAPAWCEDASSEVDDEA